MNYTELYTETRTVLCRAIAAQISDEYLDIYCQDPLDPTQTFVGVYKSEGATYIERRLADGTLKSDSIYSLSVDQAYGVLREVLAVLSSWREVFIVEVYNGGKWTEVLKAHSYRIALTEYEKLCKSRSNVRLQKQD